MAPLVKRVNYVMFLVINVSELNQTLGQQSSESVEVVLSSFSFRQFDCVRLFLGGPMFMNEIQNGDDADNRHAKYQPNLWKEIKGNIKL